MKLGRKFGQGCCLSLILLNVYSSDITKESIKGFTDAEIRRQVFRTAKYADYLFD